MSYWSDWSSSSNSQSSSSSSFSSSSVPASNSSSSSRSSAIHQDCFFDEFGDFVTSPVNETFSLLIPSGRLQVEVYVYAGAVNLFIQISGATFVSYQTFCVSSALIVPELFGSVSTILTMPENTTSIQIQTFQDCDGYVPPPETSYYWRVKCI